MSDTVGTTEQQLLALHGSPMVKLALVCEQYAGNKYAQARIRANKNSLPFPAFRLDPSSHKSPWMVMLKDIATFIDAKAAAAEQSWLASRL